MSAKIISGTETAKQIALERHGYVEEFIKRIRKEIEGEL